MPLKYVSVIYHNTKRKKLISSTLCYLRDCFVFFLPIERLPSFLRKLLYGDISYTFFIHPRRSEDLYLGLPFFIILRKMLPKKTVVFLASKMPPVVVSHIINDRRKGAVVSSLMLPQLLIRDRKKAIASAVKALRFSKKISKGKCIVGLGAWWPIISRRGLALKQLLNDEDIVITNGHAGTLLSIYLMIEKMSIISGIGMRNLKVVVIGAGKMGANVARALNGQINTVSLLDINRKNLELLSKRLLSEKKATPTKINSFVNDGKCSVFDILNQHHIGVCVTSNLNIVIKPDDVPDYFIIIDDSRPEAITRKIDANRKLVLEGGLMAIENARTNYDYGFGIGQEVFGCLAETYALSIDEQNILNPTIGKVDMDDFEITKSFYEANGIKVGPFKTGDNLVDPAKVIDFLKERTNRIGSLENMCMDKCQAHV